MTYQLYIGANNQTHKLEMGKIERILNRNHEGYTLYKATGYWHGEREASAVAVISDKKQSVMLTIFELKRELKQEAIGYQESPALRFA